MRGPWQTLGVVAGIFDGFGAQETVDVNFACGVPRERSPENFYMYCICTLYIYIYIYTYINIYDFMIIDRFFFDSYIIYQITDMIQEGIAHIFI